MSSFTRGFQAGFNDGALRLTCFFFRHPVAGLAFTVVQHGLGFYFLGWYWLLIMVCSTVFTKLLIR